MAIFDNDTAGGLAYAQAVALTLPSNFIVLRLPDTDIAASYPTIGPSGTAVLDVNGRAGGIELYLGREALKVGDSLCPVRWTGYVGPARNYQGEVESKSEVLGHFQEQIARITHPVEARAAFPELAMVWQTILERVESNAEIALAASGALRQYD